MALQRLTDTNSMTKAINGRFKITNSFKNAALQYFPVFIWKNKKKTIISSKRNVASNLIVRRRLTRVSNLEPYVPTERATFVKATNRRIELQEYDVSLRFKKGIEFAKFRLINFIRFEKDTLIKCHIEDGRIVNGLKAHKIWYEAFSSPIYSRYDFQNSELKYIDFSNINSNFLNFSRFLERVYRYRREIEFCQKVGAIGFAEGIACNSSYINMRSVTRRWLKAKKNILKLNPSPKYFIDQEEIINIAKNLQIKPNRLSSYLLKHKLSVSTYTKHIENVKYINYPLSKMYILPNNFEQLRDEVLEIVKLQKLKRRNKDFLTATKYFKKICNKTIFGYHFYIPESAECMIQMGIELNNCLKNYIDPVIEKESIIIFVRDVKSPNNDPYALELSPKYEIRQFRGKNNTTPSEKIQNIATKYAKTLLVA